MQATTRIEQCRGVNIPVRTDSRGNDVVSLWCNHNRFEVAFSDSHGGRPSVNLEGEGWVPSTGCLPMRVVPRPGLEDGIIVTLDQFLDIFYRDCTLLS